MDYNKFKSEIEELVFERKQLNNNDPKIYEYWERISLLMASYEKETIKLLDECDSENALWFSEIFDDVSAKLKSKNFIKALERLDRKFPDLNLTSFINDAKKYL